MEQWKVENEEWKVKNEEWKKQYRKRSQQHEIENRIKEGMKQIQNKDTTPKRRKWIEQENANDVGELLTRKARGEDVALTLHRLVEFLTKLADESSEERKKHRAELGNTADTDQDSDDQ